MRIGVIGSGKIGGTAARLFADAGHEVAIANSRGPESLTDLVNDIGDLARAATVDDAASVGELLLVAIPLGRYGELPPVPDGTIVVDATNYFPARDGNIAELDDGSTTSTELLAAHLPNARVVKAFNTLNWATLRDAGTQGPRDERVVLFVAGDDANAKERVSRLIEAIGFAAVDTGTLAEGGRRQQMGGPLSGKEMTPADAERALAAGD
jgi:8-hydroxy-5-deazaflavin:NADPH oxidoreductase